MSTMNPAGEPQPAQSMKVCTDCGKQVDKTSKFCPHCGLIFFTKLAKPAQTGPPPEIVALKQQKKTIQKILIGIIAALVLTTLYFFPSLEKWLARAEVLSVSAASTNLSDFDIAISYSSSASGLAWNGKEFLLGTSKNGGFVRIQPQADKYEIRKEGFGDVLPLAWNGKAWIAYRGASLLGFRKEAFLLHDPNSLNEIGRYNVPEKIAGLAWDGSGYWAATDSAEERDQGFLYRLNSDLKVVNKMAAPSNSCKGLAWDESYLWFMDTSSRKIQVLDVKGIQAATLRSFDVPFDSPSGIAFDGRTIWVNDAQAGSLMRITPALIADLHGSRQPAPSRAEGKLEYPPYEDMYTGTVSASNEDMEVHFFSATVKSGMLSASWELYIPEELFRNTNQEKIARFTITVDGGALPAPVARVYDAIPGRNAAERQTLLSSLAPGTYHIGLFLYVQYRDQNGKDRILTKTIRPLKVSH